MKKNYFLRLFNAFCVLFVFVAMQLPTVKAWAHPANKTTHLATFTIQTGCYYAERTDLLFGSKLYFVNSGTLNGFKNVTVNNKTTDFYLAPTPPTTIYARLKVDALEYSGGGDQVYGETYIRFYSDVDCTISAQLPIETTVSVETMTYYSGTFTGDGTDYSYDDYNLWEGCSEFYVGDLLLAYAEHAGEWYYYNYSKSMFVIANPNGGYTPY